jgi:hypothetical protein
MHLSLISESLLASQREERLSEERGMSVIAVLPEEERGE